MMLHKDVALEIKEIDESGEFAGYGSVFGNKDRAGDIVEPGAFAETLDAHKAAGTMPAMLWQHQQAEPIGVYTSMKEDERGLYVEGRLLKDEDATAGRAYAHMKAGSVSGLSIGYMIPKGGAEYDRSNDALRLKTLELFEVSIVTLPANPEATVQAVKACIERGDVPTVRQVERILRDAGLSKSVAMGIVAEGYHPDRLGDPDDAMVAVDILKSINFGGSQ